jgi:hypothetical protein
VRNININVYKSKPIKRESYDNDDEEEDDNYNKKLKQSKKEKVPPKTGQKVEMSYLPKNNDDSDSS